MFGIGNSKSSSTTNATQNTASAGAVATGDLSNSSVIISATPEILSANKTVADATFTAITQTTEANRIAAKTSREATIAMANVSTEALRANESVTKSALDTVMLTTDVLGTALTDTFDLVGSVTDTFSRDLSNSFETQADITRQQQSELFSTIKDIKSNEQLGTATQITEIFKYIALAIVGGMLAKSLMRG